MISPTPNPQPGGPGSPLSLAPPLETCPAWVALPGAKAPAGIALRFIRANKPLNRLQGRTTHCHYLTSKSPSLKTAKALLNFTKKKTAKQKKQYSFTTNQRYRKSQRSTSFVMSGNASKINALQKLQPQRIKTCLTTSS